MSFPNFLFPQVYPHQIQSGMYQEVNPQECINKDTYYQCINKDQRTNTQRGMIQPMMIKHQMIFQSTFGMKDVCRIPHLHSDRISFYEHPLKKQLKPEKPLFFNNLNYQNHSQDAKHQTYIMSLFNKIMDYVNIYSNQNALIFQRQYCLSKTREFKMKVIHIGSQMDFSSNSVHHFTTFLKIFICNFIVWFVRV